MMSLISIVDEKKLLRTFSLLPVGLVQLLEEKGYDLIEAPEDEFISSKGLNINVLAIKPGICVMISGCPKTKKALEKKELLFIRLMETLCALVVKEVLPV